jgi:hypothetical protein
MKLTIIEGYDNFSNENYIRDVVANASIAEDVIAKIPPNGTLPDSYQVITCELEDLYAHKIKSAFPPHQFFDDTNLLMILSKSLSMLHKAQFNQQSMMSK